MPNPENESLSTRTSSMGSEVPPTEEKNTVVTTKAKVETTTEKVKIVQRKLTKNEKKYRKLSDTDE